MRPIWRDNRLLVELHKPDEAMLRRARELGEALTAMNQDTGKPLVDAVDEILKPPATQDENSADSTTEAEDS